MVRLLPLAEASTEEPLPQRALVIPLPPLNLRIPLPLPLPLSASELA